MVARDTVAVIGSGISGLTAAYILQRRYDVTLYEADTRLGGHSHTHDVVSTSGRTLSIDSGFIVHNQRTYPHLLRLFAELGVQTQPTQMSMSVRCDGCGLEYAGACGLRGLFPTVSSLRNPAYLVTLAQVLRFHRRARQLLASEQTPTEVTLGEFVTAGRFSQHFVQHFLTPLVSAVWSCGTGEVAAYPARYLFTFLSNHGMLSSTGSPTWRTVVGGSRNYVQRAAGLLTAARIATPVRAIYRYAGGAGVREEGDKTTEYRAVVIATHADQALRLLADPTSEEQRVLSAFRYSRSDAVLHTDASVLPRHPAAAASWNYRLPTCQPTGSHLRVSYDMNRLQRFADPTRYVVTLGDNDDDDMAAIDPQRVIARMVYEHPIYTPESLAAQRDLPTLSTENTAYAGAYHGWGFHEDGCRSGVTAASALEVPW